jgi:hypothetical protein
MYIIMEKDLLLINKYCDTLKLTYYEKLSLPSKRDLLDVCFCLLKKYPQSPQIKQILELSNVLFLEISADIEISIFNLLTTDPIESLIKVGVAIIPIIEDMSTIKNDFIDALHNFPEYKRNPVDSDLNKEDEKIIYVLGGFAALGNPSSFHNKFVRNLRLSSFKKIYPFFKKYNKIINQDDKDIYLKCLFDRMMYRLKGQKPVAESWHRDIAKTNDMIFGGWVNLDKQNQYFSCVPGSHLNVAIDTLDKGFATLEKSLKKIGCSKQDIKDKFDKISKHSSVFMIPPGHMIIFPQYILHNVISKKVDHDMMRLFIGWSLTYKPAFDDSLLEDQSIVPLPGGMLPPMYSPNHVSYFLNKEFEIAPGVKSSITDWSNNNFKTDLLVNNRIPRYMKSLKESNLKLYPSYSEEEKSIYHGIVL